MKICNISKHLLKRNIDHYWHFITKINVFLSQFLMFQVSTFSKLQRIESFSQRKHKRFHRTSVSRLSLTRPKGWRRLQFDRTGNSEYNKRAIRHTFLCFSCAHNFFERNFTCPSRKAHFEFRGVFRGPRVPKLFSPGWPNRFVFFHNVCWPSERAESAISVVDNDNAIKGSHNAKKRQRKYETLVAFRCDINFMRVEL